MPSDRSLGALAISAVDWVLLYAMCQAKQAGDVEAYDAARAEYLNLHPALPTSD